VDYVSDSLFYKDEHLRHSEIRKRIEEREEMDAAVERLSKKYPELFKDYPERWEMIKAYEDKKII
jgi:thymidylate kinase